MTNGSTDIKSIALAVSSTALVLVLGLVGYQKCLAPAPMPPATNQAVVLGNAVGNQANKLLNSAQSKTVTQVNAIQNGAAEAETKATKSDTNYQQALLIQLNRKQLINLKRASKISQ